MKRYYLLIILSSLIALLSCEKINYMYYLEKDSNMTFDLNYDVEPYIKALFPYTDKDGHQYNTLRKNQLHYLPLYQDLF